MLSIHQLLLIGLVSVGIGAIVMFVYTYAPLRAVSKTLFAAIFRTRLKYKIKCLAIRNAQYPRSERSIAAFEPVGTTIMKPNPDGRTLRAVHDLEDMIQKDYSPYIQRIYLFGSRARGDFRKFSDMDVALFFLPTFKVNVFMLP